MTPGIQNLMQEFDIDEEIATIAQALIEKGMEREQAVGRASLM